MFRAINRCLICTGQKFTPWARVSYSHYLTQRPDIPRSGDLAATDKRIASYVFTLVQCRRCNFVFTTPQLSPSALTRLYQDSPSYFNRYQDSSRIKSQQQLIHSHKLEVRQLRAITTGKIILDVGCGGGYFLKCLPDSWKKFGVEVDPYAAKFAAKLLHKKAKIYNCTLAQASLLPESFDTIILRGTLEHLHYPKKILNQLHRLLKPNGTLAIIATPNIASICASLYRGNFRFVDPLHHIWYFSPSTLTSLLLQTKFTVVDIKYNYFNTAYFHLSQLWEITRDWLTFLLTGRRPTHTSPPFYGNLMDVYARKN